MTQHPEELRVKCVFVRRAQGRRVEPEVGVKMETKTKVNSDHLKVLSRSSLQCSLGAKTQTHTCN